MKLSAEIACLVIISIGLSVESSSGCDETGNYLKNGIEYEYNFIGEAVASAVGTTNRLAGIKYDCKFLVEATKSCHFQLKIKSCEVFNIPSPGNKKEWFWKQSFSSDFNTLMTKQPLVFEMSDGGIVNIKHSIEEKLWILNIKRAVVSSFLVSKSESKQQGKWQLHTDVQGTCPQKVTKDAEDASKVKTVKDMFYCRVPKRKYYELSPWSLFNNMSFIQNLINSSMACDYSVDERGIKNMECKERHAIMLESTHNTATAVQTNVMTTLELLNTKKSGNPSSQDDSIIVQSSIVYEYEKPTTKPPNSEDFVTDAHKIMADLVQTTNLETRLFTITMFTKFLHHIRSSPDLVRLVQDIQACKFMKRCTSMEKERALAFLQDALVQCNTVACIQGFKLILKDVTTFYYNIASWTWSNGFVTDPEFAHYLLGICKERYSRGCWFSLGKILGKLSERYEKTIYRQFPDSIYMPVKYVVDQLSHDCSPAKAGDKNQLDHILTMIKSLINVGPKVFYISPDVASKMLKCMKSKKIPAEIVIAATQLSALGPKVDGVTRVLWKIVGDDNLGVQVRTEAYLALANYDGSKYTAGKILHLLSTIKSRQVRNFISSHIGKLDVNYLKDSPRLTVFNPVFYEAGSRPIGNKNLSNNLMEVIKADVKKYMGPMEEIQNFHGVYSSIRTNGPLKFFEMQPWRTFRNSFGYYVEKTNFYESLSDLPHFFSSNHTLELFNEIVNFFEIGASVNDIFSPKEKPAYQGQFDYMMDVIKELLYSKSRTWNSKIFNSKDHSGTYKNILDNLKKLHSKVAKVTQSDPYFISYIKLLGKYTSMFTASDMKSLSMDIQKRAGALPMLIQQFSKPMHFNNHRNIKVIEAFHQFPTSTGLPLNWTTDATLSFSARAGAKVSIREKEVQLHYKPSGALTFINSMFVSLPTVLDTGIQANSSAFTSTQWNLKVKMLSSENISVSLSAPNRPQEGLNLFRNNYIIHENKPELLKDHKIKRVSESWCYEGKLKKLVGLKACHQRSYANVTNLIKPWFPMAASATWRLTFYKADQNLKSYDAVFTKTNSKDSVLYKVNFEAPGSYIKRSMNVALKIGPNKEFKVTLPEVPKFLLQSKHENSAKKYLSSLIFHDTNGNRYESTYKSDFINTRIKAAKSVNSSPKDIYHNATIYDKVYELKLPEEEYSWTCKVQKKETYDLDVKMLFIYRTFAQTLSSTPGYSNRTKGMKSWLHPILPIIFWESDMKAAEVLFKGNIESSKKVGFGGKVVNGKFLLHVPRTDLEITTERVHSEHANSMAIHAKKLAIPSNELKSFLNITLGNKIDTRTKDKTSVIVNLNITVPRHSIAFKSATNVLGEMMMTKNVITFAKIVRKDPYSKIGALTTGSIFGHDHSQFKLKSWSIKLDTEILNLINQWPLISKLDGKTDLTTYGDHTFKKGKVDFSKWIVGYLTYPYNSNTENTLSFKGHVVSDSKAMEGFSIFRHAEVHSKKHDSTVKSTFYVAKTPNHFKVFSDIKHYQPASSPELYGEYRISHIHQFEPFNVQLNHSIDAKHFKFSSTVATPAPKPNELIITIDTSSDIWMALNFKLYQHFSFGPNGWETMNCSDSFSAAKVNANWTHPWYKTYKKTVDYDSTSKVMPSMKLEISHKDVKAYEAKLLFKDTGNILKLTRTTPSHMKSTNYVLNYIENNVDKKMGQLLLIIMERHFIFGNLSYDIEPISSFYKKISYRLGLLKDHWNEIKNDPDHGMNKLIASWVEEDTIIKYVQNREAKLNALRKTIESNAYEFIKTWDVFYEPSFKIPIQLWKFLKIKMAQLRDEWKQKTYTGWAWNYFKVTEKLASPQFENFLVKTIDKLILETTTIPTKTGFMFPIIHPYHWLKFDESPKITPELRDMWLGRSIDKSSPKYPNYQTAVVYGNGEIYTFDGKAYRFSGYPGDSCTYILASDFVYGGFSVLKSKDSITLILKNDFYKINNKNEVFVNNGTNPASLPLKITPKGTEIKAYILGMQNIVEVVTDIGLYIVCDSSENVCTIQLNKKYRSRTAGLLGNYDGECFNDFKQMTSGRLPKNVYSFVASYEMSGEDGCKDKSLMKSNTENCNARNEKRINSCNKLFDYKSLTSENYYCFKRVYSEPFLEACKRRSKCSEFSACEFQSAYRAACYNRGIKLRTCQKCFDGFTLGDTMRKDPTRTVEIAVIVDQNSKMFGGNGRASGLKTLLEKVDSTFRNKGYSSRSYSLISFGHPDGDSWNIHQLHLASNKIWHSAQTMEKILLKKLKFNGKTRSDPLQAIEFAYKHLKFNPDASRVFIIATLDDTQGSKDVKEAMRRLKINGISLYTIAEFPSVYKGKHIYGVRGDGYAFPHPKKAKDEGREELFVSVPNGPLARLTSALDGSIFHRKFLEDNKNKAYFTELAEEVVAKVFKEVKPNMSKSCHCLPDTYWGLSTSCYPAKQ